jgi:hypothetical protein
VRVAVFPSFPRDGGARSESDAVSSTLVWPRDGSRDMAKVEVYKAPVVTLEYQDIDIPHSSTHHGVYDAQIS